jgi:hypothetical protein
MATRHEREHHWVATAILPERHGLSIYGADEISAGEAALNCRQRKTLGWKTAVGGLGEKKTNQSCDDRSNLRAEGDAVWIIAKEVCSPKISESQYAANKIPPGPTYSKRGCAVPTTRRTIALLHQNGTKGIEAFVEDSSALVKVLVFSHRKAHI